ncbi:radical SAM superfamily enzyme YgiQ (UPF0313 family) [Longispora fulva]|uniref:Radical SAM superfamily enzyme YgiQ (UPF0313 family) n=1 Tax=Longispora fulva TaxID=619741 RepID=A0A8J7KIL5_9ACTN|nr:radical SAM superfamily enzyme YgiQ (UPF0313 family) [Longispora fulva]
MIVQQGVWDMPLESMPLAAGYLKAAALSDDDIAAAASIDIANFRGGLSIADMALELFQDTVPDVMAFSVMGWNARAFGELAKAFKQLNPEGWVVFGGPHVAHQAQDVLPAYPGVDIIVNGEGEWVFRDLLRAWMAGDPMDNLSEIGGISFRGTAGIETTPEQPRIEDLDEIPSPILTGAIPLTDDAGQFRYDVALMETNRGCPYKCSFCYWGGAVGQKVRSFSMDRLRQELEVLGRLQVHTVVLCDANFGMLAADLEFVQCLIEVRSKYGYPRALDTSWAKNKSATFFEIVKLMKSSGLASSFTLALQTLDDGALESMNRRNMKVNAWESLVQWLNAEGLDCYAELIWGAPGETVESFMKGYDRLARWVSRIAVYPMLLLPNTDYVNKRDLFGFKTVRGTTDDFEYLIASDTMSVAENAAMQPFLFWARVLGENAVLRHVWLPLLELGDVSQSTVVLSFVRWLGVTNSPEAAQLRAMSAKDATESFGAVLTMIFATAGGRSLLESWWRDAIRPLLPEELTWAIDEVFRYDLLTMPLCGPLPELTEQPRATVVRGQWRDGHHYIRPDVDFKLNVPELLASLRDGGTDEVVPSLWSTDIRYLVGAENVVGSTNHETFMHYMGRPVPRSEWLAMADGT